MPLLCSTIPMRLRNASSRRCGIVAEHRHLARAAFAIALQDLHGRRLAGAVGPEQAEHLASLYLDVDAPHGLELAVALVQVLDLDRGAGSPVNLISVPLGACAEWPTGDMYRSGHATCGVASYQCTPRIRFAIASCSSEARSSVPFSPREAAESGNTR